MNITKFLNKVYFAPRLKEIEQYTSHAGGCNSLLQRLVRTAANTEWERSMTMPLSVLMKISRSAFQANLRSKPYVTPPACQ